MFSSFQGRRLRFIFLALVPIGASFVALSVSPSLHYYADAFFATAEKESETNSERCIRLRGTRGWWFVNETLGRETFYKRGFRSNRWFREFGKNASAVYPGNKYAWYDTSVGEECQIRPVHKRVFCDVARALRLDRILFVGDSLTMSQIVSLGGLIGEKFPFPQKLEFAVDCPPQNKVQIVFRRENLGPNYLETDHTNRTDFQDRQQFGPEALHCGGTGNATMVPGDYCPWHKLYNDTTTTTAGRNLLVLNQGAHFHSMETFAASFDWFVQLFNRIARPGDVVVFRATVPGHKDCFLKADSVNISEMTHDTFLDVFSTTRYDWNLLDAFNHYARQTLARDLSHEVTQLYLNVYNMTVLRPDQHVAATDCLHYTNPGPVDFWNHLLFTNLADMANKH